LHWYSLHPPPRIVCGHSTNSLLSNNRFDDSPIFRNQVYQSSDMSSKFCANSKCTCRVQFEAHYYNSRSCPPLSHGITILMLNIHHKNANN
jgi:hypothetical protein